MMVDLTIAYPQRLQIYCDCHFNMLLGVICTNGTYQIKSIRWIERTHEV